MNNNNLSGIIAYTVTPFSADGRKINHDALRIIIDGLISNGADAIAALGSAGECAYLDDNEWESVAEKTIKHVNKRVPVVVGISELTTRKAIERAVFSNKIGADVIMVSPFSYYKLTEDEIYDHYKAIAGSVSIPVMVYNNPATCGVDMSPEFMISMVNNIENITMIKESTGDIQRMHKLHSLSHGKVPFFNGCNYIALEALNAGAVGWCTVAPSLIDKLPKRLFEAVKGQESKKSKNLFYQQLPLLEFIVNGGLASTVKAGLVMKGIEAGHARLPLKPLPSKKQEELRLILSNI